MTLDDLKKDLIGRVAAFEGDLAAGWMRFNEQSKELESMHDKLLRIEGAKIFAESLLNGLKTEEAKRKKTEDERSS